MKIVINLIKTDDTKIMIPVPQYPLYSATLDCLAIPSIEYYLKHNCWTLDLNEIEKSFKDLNPTAIVVINPGNPTGTVMSYQEISDLLFLCQKYNVGVLADEVYQENILSDTPFVSFRKVQRVFG